MEVNLTPKENVQTVHLIEGKALEQKPPVQISISGSIKSISQFLKAKSADYPVNKCHILIDREQAKITFIGFDTDPYFHKVEGSLKLSKYIDDWGINKDKKWSHSQLEKFLKVNKFHFADYTEATDLISSLNKWQSKVTTTLKDWQDKSGNTLYELERKVDDVDLKRKFNLSLPIFKGFPKQTFEVEIGFEATPTSVSIYLFSDQLESLIDIQKDKIFEDEIKDIANIIQFSMVEVS